MTCSKLLNNVSVVLCPVTFKLFADAISKCNLHVWGSLQCSF